MQRSQRQKILHDLMRGLTITPIDALNDYGCFRLAARIEELRKDHWPIETINVERNGKHYAAYRLPDAP